MKLLGLRNFLGGVAALVVVAVVAYILFTIGLFVLSIAIAVALVAGLMIWVTSFFMLRKQGHSVFSQYSSNEEGKHTTVIDVEFTEVEHKESSRRDNS